MKYLDVEKTAEKWGVSRRSVRDYCQKGRVFGALFDKGEWQIPEEAEKPKRKNRVCKAKKDLLTSLKEEKEVQLPGGIYHKIQIELTYNSNHIEGSKLTADQTRLIFETNTIGVSKGDLNVDDVVETANHFRCVDLVIDNAKYALSESFIKQLHGVLKTGTSDSRKPWFAIGDYKRRENEVGGIETTKANEVPQAMKELIRNYNKTKEKTFEEIVEFHYQFEKIHPFQDGNGRVGRLIMFKECLRNGIVPFIIEDDAKAFYYRGLKEWKREKGYLLETCRAAQDKFLKFMKYFGLEA